MPTKWKASDVVRTAARPYVEAPGSLACRIGIGALVDLCVSTNIPSSTSNDFATSRSSSTDILALPRVTEATQPMLG